MNLPAVSISAYCWVLREHVSVSFWQEYAGRESYLYRGVVVTLFWFDGCRWFLVCVLFENCTVDASIFIVCKFLRAYGGCLGTRSR